VGIVAIILYLFYLFRIQRSFENAVNSYGLYNIDRHYDPDFHDNGNSSKGFYIDYSKVFWFFWLYKRCGFFQIIFSSFLYKIIFQVS